NESNLIGGIPPFTLNHGLKRDPALFNFTGDFILTIITEAEYNAQKNISRAVVFARIYAFYSNNAVNNYVYIIDSRLGGKGQLIVKNPTPFTVMLHIGDPRHVAFGYAPPQTAEVIFNLKTVEDLNLRTPEEYCIFPLVKFYNPASGELITIIPLRENNIPVHFSFLLSDDNPEYTFDLRELGDIDVRPVSGGAFIRVINNTETGVHLWEGTQIMLTSTGKSMINPGNSTTFFYHFTAYPDGKYPESQYFGNFRIGALDPVPVREYIYDLDYLYEIEVTGSNGVLQLGTIDKKDKVKFERF
ncbi:MAG: hypothetical protein FWC03_06980, partial [Treponema sp.]|nr:hypothetical protein [Treponema sp.]